MHNCVKEQNRVWTAAFFAVGALFQLIVPMRADAGDGCTVGVANGYVTVDGRPILWKVRDTSDARQQLIYTSGSPYDYIGVRSEGSVIYMGLNEAGIASGNSLVNPSGLPNTNSSTQRYILRNYDSLDQIRDYFQLKVEPYSNSGRGCFPFIDAAGNAIMFELNGPDWWLEYNSMDPDRETQDLLGFVVRANEFHERSDGMDNTSITGGRYESGTYNVSGMVGLDMLCTRTIVQGNDGANDFEFVRYGPGRSLASISRSINRSSIVVHGVAPDEYSDYLNWQSIKNIAELNSEYSDYEAKMRFDGLEIFFVSTRPGGKGGPDIWVSTRESLDVLWSLPVSVSELNSEYDDAGPCLSADGLTIYFHSQRPGGPGWSNIYVASRPDLMSPFGAPANVANISSSSGECMPYLSPDGLTLYFASDRPGGVGGWDIWWSTRPTKESEWSTPQNLSYVNSPYREFSPFLSPYDNVLYFESTRPGGLGDKDIWLSSILSPEILNVTALNSAYEDTGFAQSDKPFEAIFHSRRPGGMGGADLYRAERPSVLATMWVILGQSNYGIAVPTWVRVSNIPECLSSGDMYDRAKSLYNKGNEATTQASTFPAEAHMFSVVVNTLLPNWRAQGVPSVVDMTRIEHRMANDAYSLLDCLDNYQSDNKAPEVTFNAFPDGLTVDFELMANDPDGTIDYIEWNFGDNQNSIEVSPSHTYAEPGTYLVSCTITDDDGVSITDWRYYVVPVNCDLAGDDGVVNFSDFAEFAAYWYQTDCNEPNWCEGTDFDRSNSVNFVDLTIFSNHWLNGAGP